MWEALDVPVRACTAVGATREQALAFPRGDIRLACCPACGLLHNESFDPARLDAAGPGPIDTPAFSAGYQEKLRALAARLVERWGVRRSRVVDVGCGSAQFLAALCEAGGNLGIGIDPAAPCTSPDARIELVRELYGDRHARVPADLVCSRFLLEHHPAPRPFLELISKQVRRTLVAGRPAALAMIEVPDGRATLERGVPWEVYYEHCSYFSVGSLGRLARLAGLDVVELSLLGRQRALVLVARASRGEPAPTHELEDDLPELCTSASSFAGRARLRLEWWRSELEGARGMSRVILWGAGARTSSFLAALGPAGCDAIDCVVDVDPGKQGARMAGTGHEVIAPADLVRRPPDAVVVMNDLYLDEVKGDLERMGLSPQVVAA